MIHFPRAPLLVDVPADALPGSMAAQTTTRQRPRTYSEADIKAADLNATERERERLSIELHDGVGQHLTGIAFLAKALANRLKAQTVREEHGVMNHVVNNAPNNVANEAAQIVELTNQAIANIRALARGLQPVASEDNALCVALAQLAVHTARIYRVDCVYNADAMILVSNPLVAHHLYRIAQEAVHNALKHGGKGTISIDFTENEKTLTLAITNPGQLPERGLGRDLRQPAAGLGIASMRYRAKLLKTRMSLENVGRLQVRMKLRIRKDIAQSTNAYE